MNINENNLTVCLGKNIEKITRCAQDSQVFYRPRRPFLQRQRKREGLLKP